MAGTVIVRCMMCQLFKLSLASSYATGHASCAIIHLASAMVGMEPKPTQETSKLRADSLSSYTVARHKPNQLLMGFIILYIPEGDSPLLPS